MSHSTLGVILPLDCDLSNAAEMIAVQLAPFSEELDVPEYDKPCHCIGWIAKKAALKQATALYGKNPYQTVSAEQWQSWHDKFFPAYENAFDTHPDRLLPDPNCHNCNGTGIYQSTYNPKSKWDWYVIGGRWAGDLVGHELTEDEYNNKKVHGEWKQLNNNIAKVQSLLESTPLYTFFALLSPEGEWFERGDMGWWGMVSDEKEEGDWEKISRAVYAKYSAHHIVLVDIHI